MIKAKALSSFLNRAIKGKFNQVCDAVIIEETESSPIIYCCELKSGNPSGYEPQLVNTQLTVEYLSKLAFEHYTIKIPSHFNYIVFGYMPQNDNEINLLRQENHRFPKKPMASYKNREVVIANQNQVINQMDWQEFRRLFRSNDA